jgi:hypothetical protein
VGPMKHPVKDIAKYGCTLPPLAAVSIPQAGPAPTGGNGAPTTGK